MMQGLAPPAIPTTATAEAADAGFSIQPRGPIDGASPARVVGTPVPEPALSTLRLYAGEWAAFVTWCRQHRHTPLPAGSETLAGYLLDAAPALSRGALGRRRSAIAAMHRQAGLPVPKLDAASRKALRLAAKPALVHATAPSPTAASLVRRAAKCPRDLAGLRDRALLLLAAALTRPARLRANTSHPGDEPRASPETTGQDGPVPRLFLLALDAEDVRFTPAGLALQLRTRTDELTPSRSVTLTRNTIVHVCPVRALEDWLRASDTAFGPVFRKVDRWGNIEHGRLGPDAWYRILARRGAAVRVSAPSPP